MFESRVLSIVHPTRPRVLYVLAKMFISPRFDRYVGRSLAIGFGKNKNQRTGKNTHRIGTLTSIPSAQGMVWIHWDATNDALYTLLMEQSSSYMFCQHGFSAISADSSLSISPGAGTAFRTDTACLDRAREGIVAVTLEVLLVHDTTPRGRARRMNEKSGIVIEDELDATVG